MSLALTEDQKVALRESSEDMARLPEEAKAILRKGYYVANWDDPKENWVITNIQTGEFIAKVKAL